MQLRLLAQSGPYKAIWAIYTDMLSTLLSLAGGASLYWDLLSGSATILTLGQVKTNHMAASRLMLSRVGNNI